MKLNVSTNPPLLRWCLAVLFLGFLGLSTGYSQANDLCDGALAIACGDSATGSTTGASADAGLDFCGTTLTSAPGVWYEFAGTGDLVTVSTSNPGTTYDTKLGVFSGSCAGLVCVDGDDDGGDGLTSSVSFESTAGTTYYFYVTGFGTSNGDYELSVSCVAPPPPTTNDICTDAIAISCGNLVASTADATNDATLPFCGTTLSTAPGVWYEFEGAGSLITVSTSNPATSYDTKLGVFSGSCAGLVCVDGDDDGGDGLTSTVTFDAVAGTTYYFYVTGFGSSNGIFELSVEGCMFDQDICQGALPIGCNETVSGTTDGASQEDDLPFCGTDSNTSPGIWYVFEGDGSLINAFTCNQADYDTKIGVFSGSCGDLTCVTGNDDGAGCAGFTSDVTFTTEAGTTYYIYVSGFGGATGDFDLTLDCVCGPPSAVCQDLAFELTDTDPITITVDDINNGSTADCGLADISIDEDTFDCLAVGDNPVTLTVTDINGTIDEAVCNVTITSTFEASEVGCLGDLNVTLDENCSRRITPTMVATGNNLACATNVVITVDGTDSDVITGCGEHIYEVEIFEDGELVNTCWGTIHAEDKTAPEVDCPADTETVDVVVTSYPLGGDLSAGDNMLNLNNYSCFSDAFNPLAGDHPYDIIDFKVTADDIYTFEVESVFGDASIAIYQGGFDADNPCENIIGQNQDMDPNGAFDPRLRFSLPLIAGETYQIFVSNWNPADLGGYLVSIFADGNGGIVGVNGVENTETFDLLCEDVDYIRFSAPRSYVVNADGSIDFNASADDFFGGDDDAFEDFLEKLSRAGLPDVTDNCGQVRVDVVDAQADENGDCGIITVLRTITITDRYEACEDSFGPANSVSCPQTITFRRPTLADVEFPPFAVAIECDENYPTDGALGGPDDNVAAALAGYPFIRSAAGFQDLNQSYCNIGASYSDEPRIAVCDGAFKYRREWNIVDWCDLGASIITNQIIKIGDNTGPKFVNAPEVLNVSTSPFGCEANLPVPVLDVNDGNSCSSVSVTTYTVLANGDTYFTSGDADAGDVLQLPIGDHVIEYCAVDGCGNETCVDIDVIVRDNIAPTASCNDELNVSIGGGDSANGVLGQARIFATDIDEGSNDNCSDVTLEVRRNFYRDGDCDNSASRWSDWGDYVDFFCCDIDKEITIELRVTDADDNKTVCWLTVTPEDKLVPFCYAPGPQSLTCADLPLTFPGNIADAYADDFEGTSDMMDALFGSASGTDNCAVDAVVERDPTININECGWGTITRRFEAWQWRPEGDANGNGIMDASEVFRSTNTCSQLITITEVHDFKIDFPEDADADCGEPDIPTIITETEGCDVLSVNIGEPVRFEATGDECYKLSITYDVINWCLWDGEYTGYVLARMTEDDGEPLSVDRSVEGNERPVVCYNDDEGLCIDRRHNDRDGDSSLSNCDSPELPNYGRYIYTQFVKVYDSTAPEVTVGEYGGPTDECPTLEDGEFGDWNGSCDAEVSIPFSVSDECELFDGAGDLVVSIVSADLDAFAVDADGDGVIKSNEFVADGSVMGNITDNGDGTYVFSGTFPTITSAMGPNVVHAIRVLFEDGCGNQVSEYIEFTVLDCKGPAPICINGLTVTLMPTGEGGCAMAIWASDFEGSPIYDCNGQGPDVHPVTGYPQVTKYAIYRAEDVESDPNFEPNPADTGLVLTDEDDETTVVYIYAFDEEGNYDYCETYVLVQLHGTCVDLGNGSISGAIQTEAGDAVEGAEVNLSGSSVLQVTTNQDGSFSFAVPVDGDYSVTPYLNTGFLNGVSTFDLVLISKHILGTQPLDSPYKRIAADANNSTTITTLDLVQLRKLILNIDTELTNNTSWRFVEASHNFVDPANPWATVFPEVDNFNNLSGEVISNFVGVKIGDVNGSAQANAQMGDDRTFNGTFNLDVENVSMKAGNVYTVAFTAADVDGFQGTLALNGAELVDIEYGVASAENFGLRFADQGMITTSWNGKSASSDVLFSLVIRATQDAELSSVISVNSRYTAAEAYEADNTMELGINFSNGEVAQAGFELYQNTPNPFQAETLIGFNLPEDAEATVTISDASGRVLSIVRTDAAAGYNTINVTKDMVQGATGVLTYTVTAGEFTATKTMVAIK